MRVVIFVVSWPSLNEHIYFVGKPKQKKKNNKK